MTPAMSSSNVGGVVPLPERESRDVGEEKPDASTSEFGSAEGLGFGTVASTEEAARFGAGGSEETKIDGNASDSNVLKLESTETRFIGSGGAENRPSSSVSRLHGVSEISSSIRGDMEHKKNSSAAENYDSILSAFDQFAAEGNDEAVGYGFKIGDMVWGKVKSHPWWPGQIYNEAFASQSVRRGKHEAHHVLVAFFGDSSYGWFDPEELIPFEENFAEKARQTTSRSFLKAVEEAGDEIARRSCLGLACRCRNEFNLWPSSTEGYFVVDVGDPEPGAYSSGQIRKARDSFRPRDVVSFLHEVAVQPMKDYYCSVDFIKQKAAVLALRKALFEEFDETYAQAFGSKSSRPSRPTAPGTMDPSKAVLSGPMVIAEALGKGKISVKPLNTRDQEEDKYLFKRREESIQMKNKISSSSKMGHSSHPLLVDEQYSGIRDYMHQASESCSADSQRQAVNQQASIDIKPFGGSKKFVKGGTKKVKFPKRPVGQSTAENAILVKKKKRKGISSEIDGQLRELPLAPSDSAVAADNVSLGQQASIDIKPSESSRKFVEGATRKVKSTKRPVGESTAENAIHVKKKKRKPISSEIGGEVRVLPLAPTDRAATVENISVMPIHVKPINDNRLKDQNIDAAASLSLPQPQQVVDFAKMELQMLVTDLRSLALNPFHGKQRSCPAVIKDVFLKFRSLVYQKSLVLLPPAGNEASEGNSSRLRVPASVVSPTDKTNKKIVKPSARLDDPTKGGKKRGPSDRPEDAQKKKFDVLEGAKRKKVDDSLDSKKKKIHISKSWTVEKKILQKSAEYQHVDVKDYAVRAVPPTLTKAVKQESSKRTGTGQMARAASPTMLVMKFPAGAVLPSIPQLKAKFTRFGPLDHSGTRIFWKTYTCRLLYQYKIDAQAALKFAAGSNLFGSTNVRYFLREVEGEGADSEAVKPQKEDGPQSKSQKAVAESSAELKSCLKKPNGDGNGGGRGTRVKFVLVGGEEEEKSKEEVPLNVNKKNKIASLPKGASSSTIHSVDSSMPKFNNPHSIATSSSTPLQHYPPSLPSSEQGARSVEPSPPPATANDISQKMLHLLTRCSDVINNLNAALGRIPYQPL